MEVNFDQERVKYLVNLPNHLERIDCANENEIIQKFIKANYPGVICGLSDSWGTDKWTFDFLRLKYGHKQILVQRPHYATRRLEKKEIEFNDYIDYVIDNDDIQDPLPYYNNTTLEPTSDMLRDYRVPDYFKCMFNNFRNNPNVATLSWIFIAPVNSITPIHIDLYNTEAWNLVISGSKLWVFYPGEQFKDLEGQVNPFAPEHDNLSEFSKIDPLVVVQKPGEIVYTPPGWWHAVLNLQSGVCLTENFINSYNIDAVKNHCIENNIDLEALNIQSVG